MNPVYLGPEWESSDEEENVAPVAVSSKDKKIAKSGKKKTVSKKDDIIKVKDSSVIYVGHLPSELEENDLKKFLAQFGKIEKLRVSRSMKTGNPKGYAFAQFVQPSVAKIVAETLSGYFLGNRRLVCHMLPNPHEHLFFNSARALAKKEIRLKVAKQQRERNLTNSGKMKDITSKLIGREKKKRAKLEAMGIEYDFPGYEASAEAMADSTPKNTEDSASKKKQGNSVDKTPPSKRKDTNESETSASKKSKRKDSVGSQGSASKKSKQKESVGVGSEASATKKGKEKIETPIKAPTDSASKKGKVKIETPTKATKDSATKKGKVKIETPPTGKMATRSRAPKEVAVAQSEKKTKKTNNKRRISAP
jgi:nucleolar protein 15